MMSKVSALVVTRNRVDTLKRTIQYLKNQSYPISQIILVDNGSKDGTIDYLNNLKLPMEKKIIFQENLGGAGGFKKGLEIFLDSDSEWCWLMDDDGWPAKDALENLHPENSEEPKWRNSIVLDKDNLDRLAFGLYFDGGLKILKDDVVNFKIPIESCNPFNGTLLHRNLVYSIGLPIPEFFIKGDESEYQRRALRYGYKTESYIKSYFFHPAHREPNIIDTESSRIWVYYYKVRNIDAIGDKNGAFAFNKKSSYRLAKNLTKDILYALRKKNITLYDSFYRIYIVWCGALAAYLNQPFRWFVPKQKAL